MFANFLYVGLGGALGAMARFGVGQIFVKLLHLPAFGATICVNVFGSFLMGLLTVWFFNGLSHHSNASALFLLTGLLGGFTTFSAFSLDAVYLFEDGRLGAALIYVISSVLLSILFLVLGMMLMRARLG